MGKFFTDDCALCLKCGKPLRAAAITRNPKHIYDIGTLFSCPCGKAEVWTNSIRNETALVEFLAGESHRYYQGFCNDLYDGQGRRIRPVRSTEWPGQQQRGQLYGYEKPDGSWHEIAIVWSSRFLPEGSDATEALIAWYAANIKAVLALMESETMTPNKREKKPTESAAFRRWFGDSVVVDEDGEPLVLFHGTFSGFSKPRVNFGSDEYRRYGFHVGPLDAATNRLAIKAAEDEREGIPVDAGAANLMPLFVRAENPLRLTENRSGRWGVDDILRAIMEQAANGDVDGIDDDMLDEYAQDALVLPGSRGRIWSDHYEFRAGERSDLLTRFINSLGYDSIVYENEFEGGGDSYILFSPTQVKSAIGNDGHFDPKDPDIRKNPGRTFIPPVKVAKEAAAGLELRSQQPKSNRCCTPVGIRRAVQLANRQPVSVETLKRMRSYFQRHAVDKRGANWGTSSKGFQAWLLWGGDSARDWCNSILDELGE